MKDSSWFKTTEIAKNIWLIEDYNVNLFLISGKEKALLIDTGWGIGNLPELISTLTPLPVTVINTHGHPDHVCGNYQFDAIYLHENDMQIMLNNFSCETRFHILENFVNCTLPSYFNRDLWANAKLKNVVPFKGPLGFDLGGRNIDVYEIPGHTGGSICLLDSKEKLLFTGDSVCKGTILLHFEDSPPLKVFLKSIDRLIDIIKKIDYIMPSHNNMMLETDILFELRDGIKKVLSGEINGVAHETFLGNGLLSRFNSCGILYREGNL